MKLPEAFDCYLRERELEISNARHEWDCAKPLRTFFEGSGSTRSWATTSAATKRTAFAEGKKPKTVMLGRDPSTANDLERMLCCLALRRFLQKNQRLC